MIQLPDGRVFWPYVLYTNHGTVMGLDSRTAAQVKADWLARAKSCSDRKALEHRAHIRADMANMSLLNQKIDGRRDPEIPGVESQSTSISLDDVSVPHAEAIDEDEVMVLSGLPADLGPENESYGFVAMLADEISGVARAGGEVADDFCSGIDPREVRPQGRRKRGRKS